MKLFFVALLLLLSGCARDVSGPITANYLLAFYSCDSGTVSARCATSTENHYTYLAQSNDGLSWELVPRLDAFPGTSPGVVRRGNTLFFYAADGFSRRLDLNSGELSDRLPFTILRANGSQEYYAGPRAYLDENNRIVLFYLVGNNVGDDPEDCGAATCSQVIRSATEVSDSQGTQFIVDTGDRYSLTISNGETGGFPTIFKELSRFVLLFSYEGTSLSAGSATLTGTYAHTLTGGELTALGGNPSAIYQPTTDEFWTFVSRVGGGGLHTLRRAKHASIQVPIPIAQWADVATAAGLGLATGYDLLDPVVIDNRPAERREGK